MTFEEFFIKKKIDLAQLQRAKPALYEEFRSHYEQMGEKSFDHTKKYWFNRLRKDYLLAEPAPVRTKADTPPSTKPLASGALSAPAPESTSTAAAPSTGLSSVSPAGFKPRFKAGTTKPTPSAEPTEDKPTGTKAPIDEAPQKATAPTGFKPRFKPGTTKPAPPAESTEKKPVESKPPVEEASPKTADPAAETVVQKDAPEQASKITESSDLTATPKEAPEQTPAKPIGFKPRFKPGVTKPAAPKESTDDKPAENKRSADEAPQKATAPTGFKPRFKAGVTKPAIPQEPAEDSEPEKPGPQEASTQPDAPKEAPDQTPAKPLGFKPRFKPGITNKKNDDNEP